MFSVNPSPTKQNIESSTSPINWPTLDLWFFENFSNRSSYESDLAEAGLNFWMSVCVMTSPSRSEKVLIFSWSFANVIVLLRYFSIFNQDIFIYLPKWSDMTGNYSICFRFFWIDFFILWWWIVFFRTVYQRNVFSLPSSGDHCHWFSQISNRPWAGFELA